MIFQTEIFYRNLLLSIVFSVLVLESVSQQNLSYSLSKITYENGESVGHTRKVVVDSTGVMWITGRGVGIHSFDGRKITTYHINSKNDYFPLEQSVLAWKKKDGNLLVSDWHEQIYTFNPYTKQIIDSVTFENPKGIESGMYEFLYDSKKTIWAGTWAFQSTGDSIYVIRGDENQSLKRIDKIKVSTYPKLFEHQDRIYFSSNNSVKVYEYDGSFIKNYYLTDNDLLVSPCSFDSDEKGNLWVKSNGKLKESHRSSAVFRLNKEKDVFEIFEVEDNKLLKDAHTLRAIGNSLWLGGFREKLVKIDISTGEIEDYTASIRKLSSKSFYINDFYEDSYGVIWVTTSQGFYKLERKKKPTFSFRLNQKEKFCKDNCIIQSIVSDSNFIYVSYLSTLIKIDKKTGVSQKVNYDLDETNLGTLRSTIWDDGAEKLSLYKDELLWHNQLIDKKTNKGESIIPDLPDFRSVNKIVGGNKAWIVPYYAKDSLNELFIYDLELKKYTTHPIHSKSLKSEHPHAILESKYYDKVWISYFRRGLIEFDKKGNFKKRFKPFDSERIVLFNATVEDNEGTLWAGTTVGLIEINPKDYSYKIHTNNSQTYQGKVNTKEIKSMVFINDSILWIGCSSGLKRFNTQSKKFTTPDLAIDLREIEATASAVYFDSLTSIIYMGTKKGLLQFNPFLVSDTSKMNSNYPLLISSYTIYNSQSENSVFYNTQLSELNKIELSPYDAQLKMEFVLPNFPNSNDLLYSYKLKGFNYNWSSPSVSNSLSFNKLPAGEYKLLLRAGPDMDNINRFTKSIDVIVYQIWYKKLGFIIACVLLTMAIIVLLLRLEFRRKLNKKIELETLRTKISTDLHDDVGSILTGLAMQTEILQRKASPEQKSKLNRVSELSRSAMLRMRDAVWAMDARKDNWGSMVDRMREFSADTIELKEIHYNFEISGVEVNEQIPTLLRQNLYLIFKECITNILKHSDAKNVSVSIDKYKESVKLKVVDDGSSKQKTSSAGLGMTNIKMRAEQINATLEVNQENGFSVEVISYI